MRSVPGREGVVVVVPRVELHLACFGSYMVDTPVRTHHRRLRAECIGTVGLPAPVEQDYLECPVFVPGIPAA